MTAGGGGGTGGQRPAVAPPGEDPNATVSCSSPPCFLHELDPSYLGYLGRDEVPAQLGELRAAADGAAPLPAAEQDRLGRALLGTTSDAIVVADSEGMIRFWNPGAERIFGFAAAEAVGRSLDIIIPEAQRARHWEGFRRVMAAGESRYGEGELLAVPALRKDGTRISIEFTLLPLRAPDGRMEGMAAILRDVTRRFEELRTLRRALAEARQVAGPKPPPAS